MRRMKPDKAMGATRRLLGMRMATVTLNGSARWGNSGTRTF